MSEKTLDLPAAGNLAPDSESDRQIDEARRLFPVETLQFLDRESAVQCQTLLGHGECFGIWETPDSMVGRRQRGSQRSVDLRKRLNDFIPKDIPLSSSLNILLDECVLWMTRYALLLRIGPAGFRQSKGRPADVSSIYENLYMHMPRAYAKGVLRRLEFDERKDTGVICCLTHDDVRQLSTYRRIRVEFNRMHSLSDRGLWGDHPPKVDVTKTTNPKGDVASPPPQQISTPFPPIPDDYLAEMGPRILWLVQDLGPNLLHVFEGMPELFRDLRLVAPLKDKGARDRRLKRHLAHHNWHDRNGHVITAPPFQIKTGKGSFGTDPYTWPPQNWEHLCTLAVTLQSAHLWVALLAMAGRISEIATLKRDCIEWARDGKPYANGKTFKLSANLAGTAREWPAPEVFVQALAQQVRLVSTWEQIARALKGVSQEDGEMLTAESNHLWASLGTGGGVNPEDQLYSFIHSSLANACRARRSYIETRRQKPAPAPFPENCCSTGRDSDCRQSARANETSGP